MKQGTNYNLAIKITRFIFAFPQGQAKQNDKENVG